MALALQVAQCRYVLPPSLPRNVARTAHTAHTAMSTRLVQQIVVDGAEVATIEYDLRRPEAGNAAAALVAAGLEPTRTRALSTERVSPAYTWEPRARPVVQQSLSYPSAPTGLYPFSPVPSAAPAYQTLSSFS
jgi:hypothetical protein